MSKEQAKIVADAGGVIGVWSHLSGTYLEYAQNIRAVDVAGVDHLCIGTDTKMTPPYSPAGGFVPKPGQENNNKKEQPTQGDNGKNNLGAQNLVG